MDSQDFQDSQNFQDFQDFEDFQEFQKIVPGKDRLAYRAASILLRDPDGSRIIFPGEEREVLEMQATLDELENCTSNASQPFQSSLTSLLRELQYVSKEQRSSKVSEFYEWYLNMKRTCNTPEIHSSRRSRPPSARPRKPPLSGLGLSLESTHDILPGSARWHSPVAVSKQHIPSGHECTPRNKIQHTDDSGNYLNPSVWDEDYIWQESPHPSTRAPTHDSPSLGSSRPWSATRSGPSRPWSAAFRDSPAASCAGSRPSSAKPFIPRPWSATTQRSEFSADPPLPAQLARPSTAGSGRSEGSVDPDECSARQRMEDRWTEFRQKKISGEQLERNVQVKLRQWSELKAHNSVEQEKRIAERASERRDKCCPPKPQLRRKMENQGEKRGRSRVSRSPGQSPRDVIEEICGLWQQKHGGGESSLRAMRQRQLIEVETIYHSLREPCATRGALIGGLVMPPQYMIEIDGKLPLWSSPRLLVNPLYKPAAKKKKKKKKGASGAKKGSPKKKGGEKKKGGSPKKKKPAKK